MVRHIPAEERRGLLRSLLSSGRLLTALEAHSGASAAVVDRIESRGREFDALWFGSLTSSALMGRPDIELPDFPDRLALLREVMDASSKPVIYDMDTGGRIDHIPFVLGELEGLGVSCVVMEDKEGFKKNSLLGACDGQKQSSPKDFALKISAALESRRSRDFMVFARIESLVLGGGLDDAIGRARLYLGAGADGVMIHSRSESPNEIKNFCDLYRGERAPLMVVPTTYASVREHELASWGVGIAVYANQLFRSAQLAMEETAMSILENGRALECSSRMLPLDRTLNLFRS